MKSKSIFAAFILPLALILLTSSQSGPEVDPICSASLASLARQFQSPPMQYRPHVWWHWMGSNFRKEGITKDLEAMKEAGIGGATIFNIASSVQNTHEPMLNNPWPKQTFRGKAYWEAMKHTMKEAKRLGLTMGLHGTPGYATTGGPWIPEERGMKTLVFSRTSLKGGKNADTVLPKPELPVYHGINNETVHEGVVTSRRAKFYKDVAVMAIPQKKENVTASDIVDISRYMNAHGRLNWPAPQGEWVIYRIGQAPTMAHPHPLPDDIIGKSLEVDKMSREDNIFHWQHLLDPLKKNIGEYFGNTFTYIWVDSYESGEQDWTPMFREEFAHLKGYDPLPFIVLQHHGATGEDLTTFEKDKKEVISSLFIDKGWKTGRDMLHQYGLKMYWEPYWGPFDTDESTSIPDIPIGEFWTRKDGAIMGIKAEVAAKAGKHIVAAEAFTGRPLASQYTEDPAFLKRFADGGYASGANMYFLHHWVHQPFDDKYQPGMGMGWWGTHFGRFQTWQKPGKAFFTYLARCQMLLRQGEFVPTNMRGITHRSTTDADIFFVTNPDSLTGVKTYAFEIKDNRTPELWDAYLGLIRKTNHWRASGDSVYVDIALEPDASIFILFPKEKICSYQDLRQPATEIISEEEIAAIDGNWSVSFFPKLDKPFTRTFPTLIDFSQSQDTAVRYFAGTASYENVMNISEADLNSDRRIIIDLGNLHDIAEIDINGKPAGVLWHPPYKTDITPYIRKGENRLTVHVSVNWANRLIGDEQYPADFEWGRDRGEQGRAMKGYPDWFVRNKPRPSQRKAFTIWYYFRKDSPLFPAGLLGTVRIIRQTVSDTTFDISGHIPADAKPFDFHGFQGYDFTFLGKNAKIVKPRHPAPNRPWNWRARFWGGEPQTDIALLENGFHLVYCDVSEMFGNPESMSIWNEFYHFLRKTGLSEKSSMEGMSRGGIYIYRWAATWPDRVTAIYADAPVLDLKSWPGGRGHGKRETNVWETFKKDYGFTSEEEALAFDGNPIDLTDKIAAAGFPMLHVVGDADEIVPVDENTAPFEEKIRAAGGNIQVIHKPGIGHHPHSLKDPTPIVTFILRATQ
jgi:pimeloyl-ACP methyl ester carboxylesterase